MKSSSVRKTSSHLVLLFLVMGSAVLGPLLLDLCAAPLEDSQVMVALCDTHEDLGRAVLRYVSAVTSDDWRTAYAMRSIRFKQLHPEARFLEAIRKRQYKIDSYQILNFVVYGNSCRLIVFIRDSISPRGSYAVAWWGKRGSDWVCIDDGSTLFPFMGGLSEADLSELMGDYGAGTE